MADEKPPSYPDGERIIINDKNGAPPSEVVKHANDADEAMRAFEDHDGEVLVLDEATNRRLLWKIDRNILPVREAPGDGKCTLLIHLQLMCVVYGLNYLDSRASCSSVVVLFNKRQKPPYLMLV